MGIRRSPVSREVLGFGLMAGLGTLALAVSGETLSTLAGGLGLAAGLLALVSADRVYRPVFHGGSPVLHSGGVLLTGVYLAALLAGAAAVALPIGGFKAVRYVGRARREIFSAPGAETRSVRMTARLGLGIVVPAAAWVVGGASLPTWALLSAVIGEAIDRAEFYTRLEIVSPARQQRVDLETRLAASRNPPPEPASIRV
jgi:hypothetical protein